MVKPSLTEGTIIDGFCLKECVHVGGMASLWRVTRAGTDMPTLMKVPRIGEGEDPAAVVSFEMEQMIMPLLAGAHVPKFVAAGDFAVQPYIVMEYIPGATLIKRLPQLPLPYHEVADIGAKIAAALNDLHRQHVIHLDVKPSNLLFRPSGEAVLIDFGLAHHDRLPDLMQEEFRVPFGTAPYMAPEQLLGVRTDLRSDLFALGVLLYFFSTGVRPFGESETMRGMRRRLWRDPAPPRQLRPDYPVWLQEIVLHCLEIEPAWRQPTAAQLAFELSHPAEVKLTQRSERLRRDPWSTVLRRRFNSDIRTSMTAAATATSLAKAPIVAVAVDVTDGTAAINEALRTTTARLLATMPLARLACLSVIRQNRIALDTTLDEQGHNKQIDRLVELKAWAAPLKLDSGRVTSHVLEGTDPAAAILEFANANCVAHILIGARQDSLMRHLLGSVSAKVAAEAGCSVTVVRTARMEDSDPS
ncbi:bifunctional serine/threonine-protein kinase/universal stress protein [Rhodoplanes sp. Z2-YC6860]|uniref:bifunctional serine/threonine-protein kinase/universal stress protein n=1 Tax=Rhodoplanes sp. Z2-YC6860 TaxID=674703 RepID=UPI00078D4728|nr:bifunctional serine/threonine-protein kinase/universal stress protein [Rhodoplanes sp. Z2-YC6860]AMN45219.1 serine/threonine protein kinase [Rhodoplanes sp. Z2-YC6860]